MNQTAKIISLAKNEKEAAAQADQIGYPIVLKIVSPDIIHKSDAGGVIVNIKTSAEAVAGYKKIVENAEKYKPDAKIAGVLVQEMAPQSTEVIVGAVKDPQFGEQLKGLGLEIVGSNRAELDKFRAGQRKSITDIVKISGVDVK